MAAESEKKDGGERITAGKKTKTKGEKEKKRFFRKKESKEEKNKENKP